MLIRLVSTKVAHLQSSLFTIRAELRLIRTLDGMTYGEREYDRCTDHLYPLVLTEMCSSFVVRSCLATMGIRSGGGW